VLRGNFLARILGFDADSAIESLAGSDRYESVLADPGSASGILMIRDRQIEASLVIG
jgi:hypothetical protein